MQKVTSTVLDRKTGDVLSATANGPVIITTRGRETHVLITAAEYEQLTGLHCPREEQAQVNS